MNKKHNSVAEKQLKENFFNYIVFLNPKKFQERKRFFFVNLEKNKEWNLYSSKKETQFEYVTIM